MPGAVFFILLNFWTISSAENGSFRTSPPSAFSPLGGNSHSGVGLNGGDSA